MSSQHKNTGNTQKGIYVHSGFIFLTFIFLDMWNWQQFVAHCSCNRVCGMFSLVSLRMSIMANILDAKKLFDTWKWWVGAFKRYSHVFYMIPSFKIDHSKITVHDSMNISTSRGVTNSWVIYWQLPCLISIWVLKVHLSTMVDIRRKKKLYVRVRCSNKSDLCASQRWKSSEVCGFPELTAERKQQY